MTLKILIADDSEFMRNIIRNILIKQGINEIYDAKDGVECVKKYNENKPDLIFLDIMMPNKSGLEALKEIKKQDPQAKVVIISSLQKQKDFDEKKFGVSGYISKPFEEQDIIKAIKNNTNKR